MTMGAGRIAHIRSFRSCSMNELSPGLVGPGWQSRCPPPAPPGSGRREPRPALRFLRTRRRRCAWRALSGPSVGSAQLGDSAVCAAGSLGDCAVQGVATAEGVGGRVANDARSSLRVTLPGTCSVKLGNSTFVPGAKDRRQLGAHLASRVWVEITLTVAAWRASGKETLGDECGRLARRAGR